MYALFLGQVFIKYCIQVEYQENNVNCFIYYVKKSNPRKYKLEVMEIKLQFFLLH